MPIRCHYHIFCGDPVERDLATCTRTCTLLVPLQISSQICGGHMGQWCTSMPANLVAGAARKGRRSSGSCTKRILGRSGTSARLDVATKRPHRLREKLWPPRSASKTHPTCWPVITPNGVGESVRCFERPVETAVISSFSKAQSLPGENCTANLRAC
jgi:hypothetical protein